jgi:ATP-dependent helicase STH1/SNF2
MLSERKYMPSSFFSRGLHVSDAVQQAIRIPNSAIPDLERILQGQDVGSRVVDSAVKMVKGVENGVASNSVDSLLQPAVKTDAVSSSDHPKSSFMEDDVRSGIYPYNAFRHPFTHLQRNPQTDPALFATRLQRLLVPSIMPAGLDAHQIMNERDRYIEARIQQRIREIQRMPSTMGDDGLDSILGGMIKDDTALSHHLQIISLLPFPAIPLMESFAP